MRCDSQQDEILIKVDLYIQIAPRKYTFVQKWKTVYHLVDDFLRSVAMAPIDRHSVLQRLVAATPSRETGGPCKNDLVGLPKSCSLGQSYGYE